MGRPEPDLAVGVAAAAREKEEQTWSETSEQATDYLLNTTTGSQHQPGLPGFDEGFYPPAARHATCSDACFAAGLDAETILPSRSFSVRLARSAAFGSWSP